MKIVRVLGLCSLSLIWAVLLPAPSLADAQSHQVCNPSGVCTTVTIAVPRAVPVLGASESFAHIGDTLRFNGGGWNYGETVELLANNQPTGTTFTAFTGGSPHACASPGDLISTCGHPTYLTFTIPWQMRGHLETFTVQGMTSGIVASTAVQVSTAHVRSHR